MRVKGKNYKSIWLDRKKEAVIAIDQRLLPHQFKLLFLKNIKDIKKAIKEMVVRGAPLIGVTAAYGIYLSMIKDPSDKNLNFFDTEAYRKKIGFSTPLSNNFGKNEFQ